MLPSLCTKRFSLVFSVRERDDGIKSIKDIFVACFNFEFASIFISWKLETQPFAAAVCNNCLQQWCTFLICFNVCLPPFSFSKSLKPSIYDSNELQQCATLEDGVISNYSGDVTMSLLLIATVVWTTIHSGVRWVTSQNTFFFVCAV